MLGATCRRIQLNLLIGQKMYLCTYVFIQLLNSCSSTVVAGKLTVSQLSRNSSNFMKPQSLLPHLQVWATCPYPEPDQSIPHILSISWRSILILSFHLLLGLPSGVLTSGSPPKSCMLLFSPPYVLMPVWGRREVHMYIHTDEKHYYYYYYIYSKMFRSQSNHHQQTKL